MSRDAPPGPRAGRDLPRWLIYLVILGFYLSLRGYHSFDGDQSYRLPLLLHQQDPSAYADDPFVQAFDAFNPHRGSLLALDLVTRPLGLPAGLFLIFVLTFGATCLGVDRLARAIWPEAGPQVGLAAVGLLLAAKAGNIGTNHLFEAMVLDRLMAFALGWLALAQMIVQPSRGQWHAMAAIAAATVIHPSVGLQLALVLAASWVVWSLLGRWTEVSPASALRGIVGLVLAVMPGLGGQPRTRIVVAGEDAGGRFLALECRAAKPAAHAAALVAHAAVARVGLLSRPGRARVDRPCAVGGQRMPRATRARWTRPLPGQPRGSG